MMYQGYGMGSAGWLAMALILLGLLGLIAAVTVALVRGPAAQRSSQSDGGNAERVLADRFARGEINADEYESGVRVLRAHRP